MTKITLKRSWICRKWADELGDEHVKSKERRFFGRKNKETEAAKKIEKLEEDLKEKSERIKVLEDSVKSLVAENRNQKSRIENEFRNKIRFAAEDFFKDFIIVKDDFDKAMEIVAPDDAKKDPFIQGISNLVAKTEDMMKKHGLECFSGIGEMFDPSVHQAMSVVAVEGKEQNEIVAEYVKGYRLHERVLRPAMVIVASGESPEKENADKNSEAAVESSEESEEKEIKIKVINQNEPDEKE